MHINWPLQSRRSRKDHWYLIYRIDNLTRGEACIGRHTVKAGKPPFESNSYWLGFRLDGEAVEEEVRPPFWPCA